MARTKILIDCDPGHDDAVAILYAARHCDLIGVTTCHGNNTLENVTRNALSVLTLGGIDVPLAQGCEAPIAGPKNPVANAHGKTGLDGTALPEPDRSPISLHAVDFLIEQARAHQGELVLAVIGPASNVAMAIKREPRFAGWLREITVMGGIQVSVTSRPSQNSTCGPTLKRPPSCSIAARRSEWSDTTSRRSRERTRPISRACWPAGRWRAI